MIDVLQEVRSRIEYSLGPWCTALRKQRRSWRKLLKSQRVNRFVVTTGLLLHTACGPDRPQYQPVDLFDQTTDQPRSFKEVTLDTAWSYSASLDEPVLSSGDIARLFPNGDAAVLNVTEARVHRIGPNGVRWSWGRRGEGPRELGDVRTMTVNDAGEVVLADARHKRLVWLSGSGQWLREVGLRPSDGQFPGGPITDMVALEHDHYILGRFGPEPWIKAASTGHVVGPIQVPWHGFVQMHGLQAYGYLAGTGDSWVFGFALGNGVFVFSGDSLVRTFPYVEHVAFPSLISRRLESGARMLTYGTDAYQAAGGLALQADTLYVLARPRYIDTYETRDGRYLGTIELPQSASVTGFAVGRDTLLFIDSAGMFPAITSLRITEN